MLDAWDFLRPFIFLVPSSKFRGPLAVASRDTIAIIDWIFIIMVLHYLAQKVLLSDGVITV